MLKLCRRSTMQMLPRLAALGALILALAIVGAVPANANGFGTNVTWANSDNYYLNVAGWSTSNGGAIIAWHGPPVTGNEQFVDQQLNDTDWLEMPQYEYYDPNLPYMCMEDYAWQAYGPVDQWSCSDSDRAGLNAQWDEENIGYCWYLDNQARERGTNGYSLVLPSAQGVQAFLSPEDATCFH